MWLGFSVVVIAASVGLCLQWRFAPVKKDEMINGAVKLRTDPKGPIATDLLLERSNRHSD
jgi:hypothetical protein